ncbi:FtsX-like permease family protein [Plantactinospora soyae]|uniref:ABC-type lipoprotein release transport system permease subunit n=1 Tax=Plantactinospora soyae TaxID=1544732 RepID=A0A927R5J6_9ACTN|nr:FtsX-like permease family protein [Plantactinospora soyae]MBE1485986.1 ABC-type lipoprotein release transport system permease subunit [Plantactinospora soyae]
MAEAAGEPYVPADQGFYFRAYDLLHLALTVALVIAAAGLLIALAESIVSRRRALAALVATGVPRSTLARAVAWQTLTPAILGIVLAAATGTALHRAIYGGEAQSGVVVTCPPAPSDCVPLPLVTQAVPVPLADLVGFTGGAVAAVLVLLLASLLFLRNSTTMEELRAT